MHAVRAPLPSGRANTHKATGPVPPGIDQYGSKTKETNTSGGNCDTLHTGEANDTSGRKQGAHGQGRDGMLCQGRDGMLWQGRDGMLQSNQ
eukprot:818124-Pelagomonas_calceolata.AAC.1